MADLALNDLVQVNLVCNSQGQYSQNVRHFVVNSVVGTSATDAGAASAISGAAGGFFTPLLAVDAYYWGVKLQVIKPVLRQPVVSSNGRSLGELEGDSLPTQTCCLVKLATDLGGKSRRGRMYIPFPTEESNTSSGDPSAGYRTLVDALMVYLTTDIVITRSAGNTATLRPVIYSRLLDSRQPITSFNIRLHWGTQRRRGELTRPDVDPLS